MSNPITELLADIGILKVHVTNTQDLMPKPKKDLVIIPRTFQTSFPGGQGWTPDLVLPHSPKRQYASIKNIGADLTANPSSDAEGSVTSPGALAGIASLTVLPPGEYNVTVYLTISGTVAAGVDNNNVEIQGAQWTPTTIVLDNNIGAATQVFGPFPMINAGGVGTAIRVATIAAGTLGSIYSATISAVPTSIGSSILLCQSAGDALSGDGYTLRPGDDLKNLRGTTELYAVAYGSGPASLLSVVTSNQQ